MRDAPENMDAGADAPLTSKGVAQAAAFGAAWAPLLAERAKQGKLKVFVSPFLRTLQTADPLMKELAALVPGMTFGTKPKNPLFVLFLPAISLCNLVLVHSLAHRSGRFLSCQVG